MNKNSIRQQSKSSSDRKKNQLKFEIPDGIKNKARKTNCILT
jgi:hypothetical protein